MLHRTLAVAISQAHASRPALGLWCGVTHTCVFYKAATYVTLHGRVGCLALASPSSDSKIMSTGVDSRSRRWPGRP